MPVLKARITRRRLLALGSAGVGLSILGAGSATAATALASAATSRRPGRHGASSSTCALCGDATHTMLRGPHDVMMRGRRG